MKKEEQSISLHYSGVFEKNNTVTARTLGHALSNLQRIVDKAVIFAKNKSIKKGDALPAVWYSEADLEVKEFKKGCVIIPLTGSINPEVIGLLKGVIHSPFEQAISDDEIHKRTISDSLPNAFNRAEYKIDLISHEQLLANSSEMDKKYFAEAIYRDFDNLISPLRSSKIIDTDLISIELTNASGTKEFEFNKEVSTKFHKIVSMKQLGPLISYSGRLTGLLETKSKQFPYTGVFYSSASKCEHKLLISNEEGASQLRMYNTNKKLPLTILACPISAWGAFDERKGDIVFLKIDQEL